MKVTSFKKYSVLLCLILFLPISCKNDKIDVITYSWVFPTTINFETHKTELSFILVNGGESQVFWTLYAYPEEITASKYEGVLLHRQTQEITLYLNREGLRPGDYTKTINILTTEDNHNLLVKFKSHTNQTITYADFKTIVNNCELIPNKNYIIINGPANKSFMVTAVSSSSINFRIVLIEDDNFDYYELDLENDKILAFDVLTCICRNIAGIWSFIENERHTKRKVSALTQPTNNVLRVVYDKEYTKVVSSSVVADETYVINGISCGASVGLATMDIWFFSSVEGRRLSHYIIRS